MKLIPFPVTHVRQVEIPAESLYRPKIDGNLYLAPRYRKALMLLAAGASPIEIAEQMHISRETAWGYLEEALIKHKTLRRILAAHALDLLDGVFQVEAESRSTHS